MRGEVQLAWSRSEAVSSVQHQLDATFAELQSKMKVNRHDVDSLVAAVTLLCGAIWRLSVRTSQLVLQKQLLTTQLRHLDTFSQQVMLLVCLSLSLSNVDLHSCDLHLVIY